MIDGCVHCVLQEVWRQAGEAKHLSQLLQVCLHASHNTTAIPSRTHEDLSGQLLSIACIIARV